MKCPFCQIDNDKVIDSRSGEDGYAIRRRRACLNCDKRFTTFERVAEIDMRVVKKDGAREEFDVGKIRNGFERACWKRPIPASQVEQAIAQVVQAVYSSGEPEIDSREIGECVMKILSRIDDVAYIRFASVYRQFKDLNEFFEEVQPMLDRKPVAERPK
jgi:transcriptional repressor NrdR